MIAYRDCHAAIEWLATAFGFQETTRIESDGRVSHCELREQVQLALECCRHPSRRRPVAATGSKTSKAPAGCSWSGPSHSRHERALRSVPWRAGR